MENEEVQTVEETTEEPVTSEGTGEETGTETDTTEVVEVVVFEDRPFLTTPLNEYTVTEGLILLILLFLVGRSVMGWIKEGFFWLW